jgi:hypothetical protein
MLVRHSEVGTNEMPHLQLNVSLWQIHLRTWQVEAAKPLSASPRNAEAKTVI